MKNGKWMKWKKEGTEWETNEWMKKKIGSNMKRGMGGGIQNRRNIGGG